MAKFKVGDKVRIREDLEVDKVYGDCQFICDMENLKGEIVTIEEVLKRGYLIKEYYYLWSEEMLEEFTEEDVDVAKMIVDECEKEMELREKNKMEKTFREVIADIKEEEVWEGGTPAKITIRDTTSGIEIIGMDKWGYIGNNVKFTLQRKEYTFAEAFEALEEGKEIESCATKTRFKVIDEELKVLNPNAPKLMFNYFSYKEIKNNWYIND